MTRRLATLTKYRTPGLTLIELLITMAISTIIMLAIGSSMLLATRALPDAHSPANAVITAGEIAEQLTTELQYAVTFTERTATAVEFSVADRGGDDVPETIRYEWSGTPGDPLTRQYNEQSLVNILDEVQAFDLSYDLQTISEETPQGNESIETLLISYNSAMDLHDYPIKDTEWYGQYFLPSLPADTLSWKVTRVLFDAKADGAADGECRVQLQLPTAGNSPSGVVAEEKTLLESTLLDTYTTQEFAFSDVSGLSPQQGLCLVFRWVADATACKLWGQDRNVVVPNIRITKSTNRGASWSALTNQSLLFSVYGTVTTAGEPQIQETYYLQAIQISLRTGNHQHSAVQTRTKLLNRPEVTQ